MATLLRILLSSSLVAVTCSAQTIDLFDGFTADWRDAWREQSLFSKPTVYRVIRDEGKSVLHATANFASLTLRPSITLSTTDSSDIPLASAYQSEAQDRFTAFGLAFPDAVWQVFPFRK